MSQTEKAALFNELKAAGVKFERHYREYGTAELQEAVNVLRAEQGRPDSEHVEPPEDPHPSQVAEDVIPGPDPDQPTFAELADLAEQATQQPQDTPGWTPPVAERNETELPGQRLNEKHEDEPIRTDPETGYVWYQEEVAKPAFPKPRGRRILRYVETGVKRVSAQNGEYTEEFEVAGDGARREAEIKITLPSYQVGIYKDPRFPFKIHTYAGNRAFDLFEVEEFYGGADLVPSECKRVYVENVLCYDIRTVVRAIQSEHRQLQLMGKVE